VDPLIENANLPTRDELEPPSDVMENSNLHYQFLETGGLRTVKIQHHYFHSSKSRVLFSRNRQIALRENQDVIHPSSARCWIFTARSHRNSGFAIGPGVGASKALSSKFHDPTIGKDKAVP
jgi:hypothetical protein